MKLFLAAQGVLRVSVIDRQERNTFTLASMASTIAGYLARFEALGTEIAYAERQGYRTARFSYRDVARMAYGFAA